MALKIVWTKRALRNFAQGAAFLGAAQVSESVCKKLEGRRGVTSLWTLLDINGRTLATGDFRQATAVPIQFSQMLSKGSYALRVQLDNGIALGREIIVR